MGLIRQECPRLSMIVLLLVKYLGFSFRMKNKGEIEKGKEWYSYTNLTFYNSCEENVFR